MSSMQLAPLNREQLQPGDLLTPEELAAILNVETTTLANWRSLKIGPRFRKVGKRLVRYHRSDVQAFVENSQEQPA